MRHHYPFLLAGLSLLLSLAACSPETVSETRATRTSASKPAAGETVTAAVAAKESNQQAAAATRRRNTVLAPASEPAGASGQAESRRATRRAQLARQARRVTATATPAPGLAEPLVETPLVETPPTAVAPAGSPQAAATGLATETPVPADGPKLAQVFHIRPDRDTVLYGFEGTVMRIPAGTFVQGKGPGTAPEGLVEVRLREFYSMADILLERLSTMAGPQLLETGGMVQLKATANDQECKLRPGSEMELGFPATRPIDGMQLYAGQLTRTHGFTWKLAPSTAKARVVPAKSKHWRQPHFVGGYRPARRWLQKEIAYAPATVRRLNGYQPPRQLRRQLRRQGKRVPLVGTVKAGFELSEKGEVNDVFVYNPGQADSVLQTAVFQALRKLTAGPSRRGREATRSRMKVDVRFTADRRVLVDHLRWDRAATLALYQADTARKALGKNPRKGLLTDAQLQAAPLEVITGELFKTRQANAKRYNIKTYLSEQLNAAKELAVFRVTAIVAPRSMDWYNCDRPAAPSLLTRLTVRSNVRLPRGGLAKLALVRLGLEHPVTQPADISLILRDKRSVIRGEAKAGRVTFEQLSDSTAATLVAIRREQGQLYLALREVVVSQRVEPALAFRPVTVAELKAAMARFDL